MSDEIQTTVRYKDFEIRAKSFHLLNSKEWSIKIVITKHRGDDLVMRNFSASNSFPTEEEAVHYCFGFGKRIIDGQIDRFSVVDL